VRYLVKPSVGTVVEKIDIKILILAATLTSLYAALIGYFSLVDVYDRHFFEKEYSLIYNGARTLFIAYLFWIVYFSGYVVLRRIVGLPGALSLTLLERLAVGFFVGAAAWTLGMLVLGYAYLYYRLVAFVLTAPIVALSCRHLAATCVELRDATIRFFHATSLPVVIMLAIVAIATVFSAALLFVVKGLYPNGGHDYYTHYVYFYTTVVNDHNIWPNNVWYQYFYSKGMGLFFLAMLLTDPLAPSLVTFCFAVATGLVVFCLVRGARSATLWPWIAVILFLVFYIHTLGTDIYKANGGWGDFQKPQEMNAAFLVAILWMSTRIVGSSGEPRRMWWRACALCAFVIAFLVAISSGLVGAYMLLAAAVFFLYGGREDARAFFGLGVVAGMGLFAVMALNYATTGIPLDVGINWFWPIVDLRRVNEWGTIIDVAWAKHVRDYFWKSRITPFSDAMLPFGQNVLKYDVLWPLFGYTLAAGVVALAAVMIARRRTLTLNLGHVGSLSVTNREFEGSAVRTLALVFLFVLAGAIFAVVAGVSEPISYVRYSSFALPVLVVASALVWQSGHTAIVATGLFRWLLQYLLPIAVAAATLLHAYAVDADGFTAVVKSSVRFASGRYSIYDGYKDQSGWPARMPWGAVHPGMLAAWKEVGRGTRIWSPYIWSYCMLPDCRVEGFQSFSISPHAPEVFFGSAEKAKRILQSEGLNYFFISWDLQDRDVLPCAPLLSVEHIAENLGVKWTDGTSYLLTWLGPGITPLTPEWIAKYREHLKVEISWTRCDENPPHLFLGRKVYEQVLQGKRWGAQIDISGF
jgi:hypothetical protein